MSSSTMTFMFDVVIHSHTSVEGAENAARMLWAVGLRIQEHCKRVSKEESAIATRLKESITKTRRRKTPKRIKK